MQNGRGKKPPVVSLCTYSFEKNCDLNLSQMAVVRLKTKKIIWTTAWQMHFNLKTLTWIPISAIQDFDTNLKSIKRRRTRLSLNIFLKPNQIYKPWWSIQHIHSSSRRNSPTCKTRIVNEKKSDVKIGSISFKACNYVSSGIGKTRL